jgi:hypothetical protein
MGWHRVLRRIREKNIVGSCTPEKGLREVEEAMATPINNIHLIKGKQVIMQKSLF